MCIRDRFYTFVGLYPSTAFKAHWHVATTDMLQHISVSNHYWFTFPARATTAEHKPSIATTADITMTLAALIFFFVLQLMPFTYDITIRIHFSMAIFEQPPGKVKQNKDFSQESKHEERSIASSNEFLTISWQYVNLLSRFEFHSSKAWSISMKWFTFLNQKSYGCNPEGLLKNSQHSKKSYLALPFRGFAQK